MVLLASVRMAFQLWNAHQEHAYARAYLTTILEAEPAGFLVVDTDGYIRDTNTAYLRMTGLSREDVVGSHVSTRDIHEDRADTQQHIDRILEAQGGHFFAHHLRADGSSIPLEISTRPIETVAGPALISFCHDLS